MFLTDQDVSDETTSCIRLDTITDAAKAIYYTTKTLQELRRRFPG